MSRIIEGARLDVLQRSLVVAVEATALSLLIAYPIAYFLARKVAPATARIVLVLFTVPFLINYIVRNVRLDRPSRPHRRRSTRPAGRAASSMRRWTGCSTAISPSLSG